MKEKLPKEDNKNKMAKNNSPITQSKLITLSVLVGIVLVSALIFIYYDYNNKLVKLNVDFSNKLENIEQSLTEKLNEQSGMIKVLTEELNLTRRQQQQAIKIINSELERIERSSKERTQELEEQILNIEVSSQVFSRSIINEVIQSVVSIHTNKGLGSGVVVADGGYLVTNYHIIQGISQLTIYDVNENVYSGKLIAIDEDLDLALLKANGGEDLPKLEFEQGEVYIGDKVIALGNPGGLSFSVTEGIVSAVNRERNGNLYHQTDVSINPGNSGGPLVNLNKKIIGINTFKISGFEGVGFALASPQVEDFVEDSLSEYLSSLEQE